jgi:hypothetical protein
MIVIIENHVSMVLETHDVKKLGVYHPEYVVIIDGRDFVRNQIVMVPNFVSISDVLDIAMNQNVMVPNFALMDEQ